MVKHWVINYIARAVKFNKVWAAFLIQILLHRLRKMTMSTVSVTLAFLVLLQVWIQGVSCARISCTDERLLGCTKPIEAYLASGVVILKDANETFIGVVCGKYLMTSECLSVFIYYCPTVKQKLQDKVKQFEYACNADTDSENWPYMPTIRPDGSERVDEELAKKEKEDLVDSAIKASVAAAVTILLILVCVMTDCASKWRIRQRIKKAAAASANQGEPLLKNADNQETNEAASNEAITKKE